MTVSDDSDVIAEIMTYLEEHPQATFSEIVVVFEDRYTSAQIMRAWGKIIDPYLDA